MAFELRMSDFRSGRSCHNHFCTKYIQQVNNALQAVWPDLAKFHQLGKKLKVFDNFLMA